MLKKNWIIPVIFICFIAAPALANKSSTAIDAPDKAAKGTVITIKVNVTHNGNNFMHHTNWVYISVNGKEIGRWEFSSGKLPEAETFTREVSYTIEGPFTITAEANCNIHGSAGKVEKKVEVE